MIYTIKNDPMYTGISLNELSNIYIYHFIKMILTILMKHSKIFLPMLLPKYLALLKQKQNLYLKKYAENVNLTLDL